MQIERNGRTYTLTTEHDGDAEPPWERGDGMGIVSDWTLDGKRPGERALLSSGLFRRYFDWTGTVAKAKSEGWGISAERLASWTERAGQAPTAGQIAEAATQQQFDWFRGWHNGDWSYQVLKLSTVIGGKSYSYYLNGVESTEGPGYEDYIYDMVSELEAELAPLRKAETDARELAKDGLKYRWLLAHAKLAQDWLNDHGAVDRLGEFIEFQREREGQNGA